MVKTFGSLGLKSKINVVVITGLGITSIAKSDIAGKIILGIPVKIATGRLTSTIKPMYIGAYSIVRYISTRAFTKTVSSNVDSIVKEDSMLKIVMERVKEFFYS